MMDSSEQQQISAALHGDPESFEMLIRTYSRTLFAIAFAILQDCAEAEDVVQETFLRAWKTRWRVRDPQKFPAWLTAIARNCACDFLRKRRTVPLDDFASELSTPLTANPDEQSAAADSAEEIREALAQLPEQHRTALTLRYLQGMDHRAIEQTMGISNGALRGILGRALASMRKLLKPNLSATDAL